MDYKKKIEGAFEDAQIRRGLSFLCGVIQVVDDAYDNEVNKRNVAKAVVDALYCTTNSPFLLTFHNMLRGFVVDAGNERASGNVDSAVAMFLKKAVPFVQSMENGKQPSSYME